MSLKTLRNFIVALTCVVLIFVAGYRSGEKHASGTSAAVSSSTVTNTTSSLSRDVDFALFWDVWRRIESNYVDRKSIDAQKMVYGAISGMVQSLGDPYTVFLPPTQNKDSKDSLGGHFEGIGAQLGMKEKQIIIVAPLKGTPAEKAGLKAGDWIVKVDGKETINWTIPETVTAIRGVKGTKVVLTILHKDAQKTQDISVMRDTINIASVEWSLKNKGNQKVAYLKLSQFGDRTNNEWEKAVTEINQKISADPQIKGVVLDLRNNPGGYLSGAVYIGSEFLKDGAVVLQETADGHRETFAVNRKGNLTDVPLTVLINKGSASASEIVAGAIQKRNRAKLVGETSFGKGSIQDVQELTAGAGLHVTVAKWLLPNGEWIHGKGLTPDVVVAEDTTQSAQTQPEVDTQLQKAIDLLIP